MTDQELLARLGAVLDRFDPVPDGLGAGDVGSADGEGGDD